MRRVWAIVTAGTLAMISVLPALAAAYSYQYNCSGTSGAEQCVISVTATEGRLPISETSTVTLSHVSTAFTATGAGSGGW